MIDLLTKEIRHLHTGNRNSSFYSPSTHYIIHCSVSVLEAFVEDFKNIGFTLPTILTTDPTPLTAITTFQSPSIGTLQFITDMEQGYFIREREPALYAIGDNILTKKGETGIIHKVEYKERRGEWVYCLLNPNKGHHLCIAGDKIEKKI